MQYVGQTKRKLKEREHFNKMKNLNKLILFSTSISHELETHDLQIKLWYNQLKKRFLILILLKDIKNTIRHETELKWIKSLQTPFPLGFNDNIYYVGNISKMPDFDVFSLFDIRRRNMRSRGKHKTGYLKRKHKNKTFWTPADLWKILKSGRHQMLSKNSSLSIASLHKLDEEANIFYERKHDFYHTALLTRCYTQNALRPYIDSEMNHIRHFIKIPFINKGLDFINVVSVSCFGVRFSVMFHFMFVNYTFSSVWAAA